MSLNQDTQIGDVITYEDMANPGNPVVVVGINYSDPWSTFEYRDVAHPADTHFTDGRQHGWRNLTQEHAIAAQTELDRQYQADLDAINQGAQA